MLSNNGDVDTDNMSEGGGDDEEATEESSTLRKWRERNSKFVPIPTYVAV